MHALEHYTQVKERLGRHESVVLVIVLVLVIVIVDSPLKSITIKSTSTITKEG